MPLNFIIITHLPCFVFPLLIPKLNLFHSPSSDFSLFFVASLLFPWFLPSFLHYSFLTPSFITLFSLYSSRYPILFILFFHYRLLLFLSLKFSMSPKSPSPFSSSQLSYSLIYQLPLYLPSSVSPKVSFLFSSSQRPHAINYYFLQSVPLTISHHLQPLTSSYHPPPFFPIPRPVLSFKHFYFLISSSITSPVSPLLKIFSPPFSLLSYYLLAFFFSSSRPSFFLPSTTFLLPFPLSLPFSVSHSPHPPHYLPPLTFQYHPFPAHVLPSNHSFFITPSSITCLSLSLYPSQYTLLPIPSLPSSSYLPASFSTPRPAFFLPASFFITRPAFFLPSTSYTLIYYFLPFFLSLHHLLPTTFQHPFPARVPPPHPHLAASSPPLSQTGLHQATRKATTVHGQTCAVVMTFISAQNIGRLNAITLEGFVESLWAETCRGGCKGEAGGMMRWRFWR